MEFYSFIQIIYSLYFDSANTTNGGGSNHIMTKGTTVAAKQPKSEEWILAVVIQYHPDRNKYQVEDIDGDDFGEKQ